MTQIALPSTSQLGKAGRRLALGTASATDLEAVSLYIEHADLLQARLVEKLRAHLRPRLTRDGRGWHLGGRAKTEITLIEKLRRTPAIQLPNIDDVAGVRVVGDILRSDQRALAIELAQVASETDSPVIKIVDRCECPKQGYRAIHAVLRIDRVHVEIQVRTSLQHLWAELYERFADHYGRWIRYYPIELSSLTSEQLAEAGAPPGSNAQEAIQMLAMIQEFASGIDQLERAEERHAQSWEKYRDAKAARKVSPEVLIRARRTFRDSDRFYSEMRRLLAEQVTSIATQWDELMGSE